MAKRRQKSNGYTGLVGLIVLIIAAIGFFSGCDKGHQNNPKHHNAAESSQVFSSATSSSKKGLVIPDDDSQSKPTNNNELATLDYQGQQIIQVNNGQPGFTAKQLSTANGPWVIYSARDNLGRSHVATGLLNKSLMPHAKRQRLVVNPPGFKNRKVMINGHSEWLYNRAHLIGYQFTGQNNNLQNLTTGTRSLNDPAMTHYENMVAMYLRSHPDDYVRYQITPIYRGDELVPRGIQMQAQSINSNTIRFNIYIFNVQAGIKINYQNGYSTGQ